MAGWRSWDCSKWEWCFWCRVARDWLKAQTKGSKQEKTPRGVVGICDIDMKGRRVVYFFFLGGGRWCWQIVLKTVDVFFQEYRHGCQVTKRPNWTVHQVDAKGRGTLRVMVLWHASGGPAEDFLVTFFHFGFRFAYMVSAEASPQQRGRWWVWKSL